MEAIQVVFHEEVSLLSEFFGGLRIHAIFEQ
jgi:hypothetical protein